MSRWLAIVDPQGRLRPGEGDAPFRIYPWFRQEALSVLQKEPHVWLGALARPGQDHPGSFQKGPVSVLWDGAIYESSQPAGFPEGFEKKDRKWLAALSGRWSFLVYDEEKSTLWMARDRVGVKPLYYWSDGQRWVFASEPKLILALPFVEKGIDTASVFDYFVSGKVDSGEQTLFKGIHQVLPSHDLVLDLKTGDWKSKPYFTFSVNPDPEVFHPEKAAAFQSGIRSRLEAAVRQRLTYHPAPPASLLSGGLDSSVLAALIHHTRPASQTALTAAYHDEAFAEQGWAKKVVDHLGLKWFQTFPTLEGLREDLEDFIYSQDSPTFSSGTYSQYCLFRLAAREGIPVVFDGQGADALFGGHLPHLPPLWSDYLRSGQWKSLPRDRKSWQYWATHWLKYQGVPALPAGAQHIFKKWYFPELRYLNPDILEQHKDRYTPARSMKPHGLNQTLMDGYAGGGLSFLLKCVDRASSWAGVETCTPYSDDKDLMEYVHGIPGTYKIRKGVRKWLLRESCKDLLPAEILYRQDKMGLVTPNNSWMAQLRPLVRAYLEEQDDAVFNKKILLGEFDQFFNPPQSLENYRVYRYLSMIVWRSVFQM